MKYTVDELEELIRTEKIIGKCLGETDNHGYFTAFEFIIDGQRYEAEYCIYKEDFIERQLAEAIVKQSECIEEKNGLKD